MTAAQIIATVLAAVFASFCQSFSGFGYAIVIMAVLPFFAPSDVCAAVSVPVSQLINLALFIQNVKHLKIKYAVIPAAFSVAGLAVGLFFNTGLESSLYLRILGGLLVVLSAWFMFFSSRVHIPANIFTGGITGIVSGVCGALFGISGPPVVLYYNNITEDKETYMALVPFTFLIQAAVLIGMRTAFHLWPAGSVNYLLPMTGGTVIGYVFGRLLFKRVSSKMFTKIIYIIMCAAGLYYLIAG